MRSNGGNSKGVSQSAKNGLLSVIVGLQLPRAREVKGDQEQVTEISRF
jgi:hypothetical protein